MTQKRLYGIFPFDLFMGAAMEPFRLRMKIGVHEFEAEGEQEGVERQFALWRELIASTPQTSASSPPLNPPLGGGEPPGALNAGAGEFDKIFHRTGKLISLTVLPGPDRAADAALLLLLGHRLYNQVDQVGGTALLSGLKQSGYDTARVDRVLDRHVPELVLRTGVRRAVKYRLNNPGLNRATELARELVTMVP